MKPHDSAAPRDDSDSALQQIYSFCRKTFALTQMEIQRLSHDPTELVSRAVQPVLWLLVFGQVMGQRMSGIYFPPPLTYEDFLAPGVLAQSVLFIAIFYGIAIIWERDLGIVHKYLASPTPRVALVLGKAISAGVRSLSQVVIVYLLALLIHVYINWNPLALLTVLVTVIFGAAFFSTFSLVIACIVKTRERFMGIGQLMTMPLFFASSALYSIDNMPTWLKVIARGNPLTYEVDALRQCMIVGGGAAFPHYPLGLDLAVLFLATTVLILVAAALYPRVAT